MACGLRRWCWLLPGWLYCETKPTLCKDNIEADCLSRKLFASNIAIPMIAYVYWPEETSSIRSSCINIATLAGTVFGQLLFGFLADKNGRKKMYGIELAIILIFTLYIAMASAGAQNNMSIYAWLISCRFLAGIGVGADYPLSAVITSE